MSRFMVGIGRKHQLVPGDNVMCFPPDVRHAPTDWGVMQYETAASQSFKLDRAEREKRRNDRLERRLDAQERRQKLLDRALSRSRGPDPGETPIEAPIETPIENPVEKPEKKAADGR